MCSIHFLKNIIKDVEELNRNINLSDKLQKSFIFCFTLLQNSTSLDEFDNHLFNVYTVYCSPLLTESCNNSFEALKISIEKRNLNADQNIEIKNEETEDLRIKKRTIENKDNPEHIKNETNENLKLNSPFTSYYSKKIKVFEAALKFDHDSISDPKAKNEFYRPEIFLIIVKILHIMPLWSGVMIFKELVNMNASVTTRLSNNIVENWFNQLRNHILKLSKKDKLKNRKTPSQMIPTELRYIKQKYEDYYQSYYEKKDENIQSKENNKSKTLSEIKEVWKSGTSKSKSLKSNGYFKPQKNIFSTNESQIEIEFKSSIDKNFLNIFDSGNF